MTQQTLSAFDVAKRHSKRVRFLRFALPVGIFVGLIGFVGYSLFGRYYDPLPQASFGSVAVSGTKVTMDLPVLKGYGKQSKPFEMRAETAVQDLKEPSLVDLQKLSGSFELQNGGSATLLAERGLYHSTQQKLNLQNGVRVTSTLGYDVDLKSAHVDFKTNVLISEEPVKVKFEGGHVHADSMSMTEGGNRVTFQGRVKMMMSQSPSNTKSPLAPASGATP
jgi:lipopolysaccharide export system protein LptC